jgi:exopolysaccharide biosynthesis polyprenyl glycosylphosphotransferase
VLKERAKAIAYWVWTTDLVLTTIAFVLAWWLRSHLFPRLLPGLFPTELYAFSRYLGILPLVLAIWTGLLLSRDAYSSHRTVRLYDEVLRVARVVVLGTLILAACGWLMRLDFVSRPFLVLFSGINLTLLIAEKLAIRLLARHVRQRGYNYRTLIIVGINSRAREMARTIQDHPYWGLRVLGFVAPNGAESETFAGLPVLGTADELPRVLQDDIVDEVLFVLSRRQLYEFEESFVLCSELGIRARVALYFPHIKARLILEELAGTPLLTFTTTPAAPFPMFVKQLLDYAAAAVGLVVLSPLLLAIGAVIKLTSPGPVLFRQTRCGVNGRPFTLLKLRTMFADAESRLDQVAHLNEVIGPAFKARHDPRVTGIGRLLRRFSIDELPQLVNVLKGDMSLVGPRPPIPSEVSRYQHWQRRRLSMKPGLTGLWQVSGRADIDDFNSWIELDLAYIDNWSLWLDLKIILKTVPAVLSARGAS